MQAVILNSGMGSRMKELTEDRHKSMVGIKEGLPLIVHQIQVLSSCGIKDFIITTGYRAEQLQGYVKDYFKDSYNFTFVYNPKYQETNYIYSLYLAKDIINEDVLLLHGDLYFTKDIITDMQKKEGSCVVIDTTLPLPEKDFKARLDGHRIMQIGTYVKGKDCYACQPLYKLQKEFFDSWMEEMSRFCLEGNDKVYAEEALNNRLQAIRLDPYDLKGRLCMEVDTKEDLTMLRTKIFKESDIK